MAGMIHVRAHGDVWAVEQDGRDEPLSTFPLQRDAVAAARQLAAQQGVELAIHGGADGRMTAREQPARTPPPRPEGDADRPAAESDPTTQRRHAEEVAPSAPGGEANDEP